MERGVGVEMNRQKKKNRCRRERKKKEIEGCKSGKKNIYDDKCTSCSTALLLYFSTRTCTRCNACLGERCPYLVKAA